jgi:hypothetical protein
MNVSETWFPCRDKLSVSLKYSDVICLRLFGFVYCAAGRATDCDITRDIHSFIKSERGLQVYWLPCFCYLDALQSSGMQCRVVW